MERDKLVGVWYRSHEEEAGDRRVYRDREFPFPPARGARESLTLNADGSAAVGKAGPADAARYSTGSWRLSGSTLTVSTPRGEESYEVDAPEDGLLVLRTI